MRKLLLVIVLAAALAGLTAAPAALAQPLLEDGVYVFVYDGSWYPVVDGQIQWNDGGAAGTPIPGGQPVWLVTFWAAYGYGHIASVGNAVVETLVIDGTTVVSGKAASTALWSVPYPSEALDDESTPFNANNRIGGWVAAWLYPVHLAPGTHEVSGTETYPHPFTDLWLVAEDHPGPLMYPAGSTDYGTWELVLP